MLSIFALASLVLSLSATVLADGAVSQEQQLQLAEKVQLPALTQEADHLEKHNDVVEAGQNGISSHGAGPDHRSKDVVILHPDGQWHTFLFGKAGSTVNLKFVFNLRAPALLDITDLFCPGDAFRVIDNGKNIGRTPLKRADGCKVKTSDPDVAFSCDTWSHRSFELGKGKHVIEIQVIRSPYCRGAGAIRLNPIVYTCLESESSSSCSSIGRPIRCSSSSESPRCPTSEPIRCSSSSESSSCTSSSESSSCTSSSESPRCSSSSESSSCSSSSESPRCPSSSESPRCTSSEPISCSSSSESPRCPSSESSESCPSSEHRPHKPCGEFTVVTSKVPFCEAEQVCRALGLKLANLTNENFLAATEAAFRCSGEFSQTWIKSWYGDTYLNSCLVLSTGADAPGGAINVPNDCRIELPILCQRCGEGDRSCDRQIIRHHDCESESSEESCPRESSENRCPSKSSESRCPSESSESDKCPRESSESDKCPRESSESDKCPRESSESRCTSESDKCTSESSEPRCEERNRAPFVLINKLVPFCEAAAICKKQRLELANLNDANFLTATTIAFHEGGANKQSWIASWNGDDYEGTPLALSTGSASPGGSINRPTEKRLPVLCQQPFRHNYQ